MEVSCLKRISAIVNSVFCPNAFPCPISILTQNVHRPESLGHPEREKGVSPLHPVILVTEYKAHWWVTDAEAAVKKPVSRIKVYKPSTLLGFKALGPGWGVGGGQNIHYCRMSVDT